MKRLLLLSLLFTSPLLLAAPPEPDITLRPGEEQNVEEYRINNQLYMIKITPSVGPAYYLIDSDGDGDLETKRFELDENQLVPQWVLFRFR